MMVTVLVPAGAGLARRSAIPAQLPDRTIIAARACAPRRRLPASAVASDFFAAIAACRPIGTATTGSPPNGSSPTIAHMTNTPKNSASAAGNDLRHRDWKPAPALRRLLAERRAQVIGRHRPVPGQSSGRSPQVIPGESFGGAYHARATGRPEPAALSPVSGLLGLRTTAQKQKRGGSWPPRIWDQESAAQLGTAAFGFGGKAASVIAPRNRSSASLSALSSFSSGGT